MFIIARTTKASRRVAKAGLDTWVYSHLPVAYDEYLHKHHAQGQGASTSQSICVQIFVVKQINAKCLATKMS